jgi:prepilin-type N-terminal cleavage/methylation domain-containing protein
MMANSGVRYRASLEPQNNPRLESPTVRLAALGDARGTGQLQKERRQMRRTGSESGVTLAELLVVVAIIGVIATVIAVRWGPTTDRARDNAARATMSSLLAAVSSFHMVHGCFPHDVGPSQMPPRLAPFVGGRWPAEADYQAWWHTHVGVTWWHPGGRYGGTQWLIEGVSHRVCP